MATASDDSWLRKYVRPHSPPVVVIRNDELIENKTDCTSLGDFRSLGSYNWSTTASKPLRPVIVVPGQPSRLIGDVDRELQHAQLIKSVNKQMCDENRHFQSDYPLEALFRAVRLCSPTFRFDRVDIATDRNNLRKLLNFVEGQAKDSFRIDFQRVGKLTVLVRSDEKATLVSSDYGKDFESRATVNELNQGGYRRIVTYKFGSLRVVARFEVDCCAERGRKSAARNKEDVECSVDSLASSLAGVNIGLNPRDVKRFDETSLAYVRAGGEFVADEKLVELTTKSTFYGKYEFPTSKWNQLFFSNTDMLVIGWHSRGRIEKLEQLTLAQVAQRSQRSADMTRTSLGKLATLLERLRSLAAAAAAAAESSVYSAIFIAGTNELSIYKCEHHPGCLPKKLFDEIAADTRQTTE